MTEMIQSAWLGSSSARLKSLATRSAPVDWLNSTNAALGGVAPITLLHTDIGLQKVLDTLGRIERGGFAQCRGMSTGAPPLRDSRFPHSLRASTRRGMLIFVVARAPNDGRKI